MYTKNNHDNANKNSHYRIFEFNMQTRGQTLLLWRIQALGKLNLRLNPKLKV